MYNEFVERFNTSKFVPLDHSKNTARNLLVRAIQSRGLTTRQFAEKTGIKAPSLYHHVSGGREISRELAIEYSKKLNCDPVDLMFEKKSIPVWAKVDLYKYTELEDSYKPGRLFSYKAMKRFRVLLFQEIFTEQILKQLKLQQEDLCIITKLLFIIEQKTKKQIILNQLCVSVLKFRLGPKELYR